MNMSPEEVTKNVNELLENIEELRSSAREKISCMYKLYEETIYVKRNDPNIRIILKEYLKKYQILMMI